MEKTLMTVSIFLPTEVFLEKNEIRKVSAEGMEGWFTLLPEHIDYVAILTPSILTLEDHNREERYFAVDHGTLVKRGKQVSISTRRAIHGKDLDSLAHVVKEELTAMDDLEKKARSVLVGMEHSIMQRFAELNKM